MRLNSNCRFAGEKAERLDGDAQGVRIIVTVECTESKGLGATPSRYCTQKVRPRGHCELTQRFTADQLCNELHTGFAMGDSAIGFLVVSFLPEHYFNWPVSASSQNIASIAWDGPKRNSS